jgi:hypothetical protein
MLLPGILVELTEETQIEVVELHLSKDGDETIDPLKSREAKLRLSRGTLLVSVGRAQAHAQVFVETNAGVFSAGSGRAFRVVVSGDRMRIMCVRGIVNFAAAPDRPPINIGAGYFAEWPGALTPRAAAEAGPKPQAEVTEILRQEKRLRLLQQENESRFTAWGSGKNKKAAEP